jgi:hypothetical protein
MIKTSWLIFFAATVAQAQVEVSHEMANGSGVLVSGVTVTCRTALILPPNNPPYRVYYLPLGSAFGVSGDTMRHVLYDKSTQSYFGYDMGVKFAPGSNTLQVSFGPPTVSAMLDTLKAIAGDLPLIPAAVPKYPPPQTVRPGDTIALDLMVSPDGRERVVDQIQFTAPANADQGATGAIGADDFRLQQLLAAATIHDAFIGPVPVLIAALDSQRDFTIDDGPIRIPVEPPSVLIDGKKPTNPVAMLTPRSGATLWFYFPGNGRFILSLAPHDRFVKLGTIRGNEIVFNAGGHRYDVHLSTSPTIAPGPWNLYVLHDPAYQPSDAPADLVVGSVDRLENLLPKRL